MVKAAGAASGTSNLLRKASPVLEIAMDDTITEYEVSHREIVELFGLQPRHLRIFSHPHSHAGMISYGSMLVFKLEHLKGERDPQAHAFECKFSVDRKGVADEQLGLPFACEDDCVWQHAWLDFGPLEVRLRSMV